MPTFVDLTCDNCGKPFKRELKYYNKSLKDNKSPEMFCCPSCALEFQWNTKWSDKRKTDKETKERKAAYHKKYMREVWYPKNKEKHRKMIRVTNKQRQRATKQWVQEYKENHPCEICGETRAACLVFHHINPKEKDFSVAKHGSHMLEKVKQEIAKCQVLCSNCHMILHKQLRADSLTG